MKPLILALLLLLMPVSIVAAQANTEPVVKLKNWRERMYRGYRVEDVQTARKKFDAVAETVRLYRSAPKMDNPQLLVEAEERELRYKKDLDAAESELRKLDETFADPQSRKAWNKEAKALFQKRNEEIARDNASYVSLHPRSYSTFRIDCYSGGFGRHFWVRCTTSSY